MEETIFIQYSPKSLNFLEESCLDLDFAFDFSDNFLKSEIFYQQNDQDKQELIFEPFADNNSDHNSIRNYSEQQNPNFSTPNQIQDFTSNDITQKKQTNIAKSKKTKNICFNICQKTVKVIKNRTYNEKFLSFCTIEKSNPEQVILNILKCKKNLSGPKALQMFVQTDNSTSRVFSKFMKWFLKQKYLRHAINQGTMNDLKGYLQFKNSVILNILEK